MKTTKKLLLIPATLLALSPLSGMAGNYDWSGLTVGLTYGNIDGDSNPDGLTSALASGSQNQEYDEWDVGGQISYDYQDAKNIVIGVVLEQSSADIDDRTMDGNYLYNSSNLKDVGSLQMRLGYAFDRVLPYATFGMGWADVSHGSGCAGTDPNGNACGGGPTESSSTESLTDMVYGLGIKYAVTDNLIAGMDYTHFDFGSDYYLWGDLTSPGAAAGQFDTSFDVFKMHVGYKF